MPGFDGTGPLGRGAMTGWRRGWCMTSSATQPQQGTISQSAGTETQEPAVQGSGPVVYGRGRGGIPRGCGRGFEGGVWGGRCGGWCWRT